MGVLEAFLQKGYSEEYFNYFYEDYCGNVELDEGDEEMGVPVPVNAFDRSCAFMDRFNSQKQLGFSDEWAYVYAFSSEDESDIETIFDRMDEAQRLDASDVRLLARLQNKGQLYEDVFVNAYETESAPGGYSYFQHADEYIAKYNELIEGGHSENYAEAYLDFYYRDDEEPELFAQAVEDAIQHGFEKEDARRFAEDARLISSENKTEAAFQNLSKYPEEWQHDYIFHWLAKEESWGLETPEDYRELFEKKCKSSTIKSIEDLYEIEDDTLEEYYQDHYNERRMRKH